MLGRFDINEIQVGAIAAQDGNLWDIPRADFLRYSSYPFTCLPRWFHLGLSYHHFVTAPSVSSVAERSSGKKEVGQLLIVAMPAVNELVDLVSRSSFSLVPPVICIRRLPNRLLNG